MSRHASWNVAQYLDDGQSAKRYRELASYPQQGGRRRLSLVLNDTRFAAGEPNREFIVLPLGHGLATVSTSEPRPADWRDHDHFFLLLILRRYATAPADPEQIADLRDGWVYVYRNGYLWRELQVVQGTLRDVNLKAFQGQDERPATGESDRVVIVPYKVNGEEQQIEIAYSEVQWSWARINALGGMDPDPNNEPRLASGTPMPEVSTAQATENRSRRLQPVTADLTAFLNDGDAAHVEPIDTALPKLYSLALHEGSALPVVWLSDPLGIATSLAQAHETDWADMETLIESVTSGIRPTDLEHQARLGQHAPKPSPEELEKRQQILAQFEVALLMQQIGFATDENRKKYGKHLNRQHFDVLLGTKERRQQREKIQRSKDKLANYLKQSTYQTALEDYLENVPARIIRGKGVVLAHARFLDRPANALDARLDRPDQAPQRVADAGSAYIDALQKGGTTAARLLDKVAEVPRQRGPSSASASPASVEIMQDSDAPLGQKLTAVLTDEKIPIATKAGTIGAALVETFAARTTTDTATLEWLAKRLNTLKIPGLPEFVVVEQSFPDLEIPDGYEAVGGGTTYCLREAVTAGTLAATHSNTVVYPGTGPYRAVVSGRSLRILPVEFKRVDVLVRQIVARDVKPPLAKIAARYKDSIARAGAVKPLFLSLELVNLQSAWRQVLHDSKSLNRFGINGIALAGAAGSAAEQLAELSNLWLRVGGFRESQKLGSLARVGKFVGNGAAGVVNLWDFGVNYIEKDGDASAAYVLGALAAMGAVMMPGLGWLGVTLLASTGIGSVIAAALLEDDPLERFAKNGPLSQALPAGGDIWEQIRVGAARPAMSRHFSAEWRDWSAIRSALIDDYLYSFQTDLRAYRERVRLPAKDLDQSGRIEWKEKAAAYMINTFIEVSRATRLEVKITLPPFVPVLSDLDFQCRYYPKGFGGPMHMLSPLDIEQKIDETQGQIETVHLYYSLDGEQIRLQEMTGEYLFCCRIRSSKHASRFYPAPAQNGEFRYLAKRQATMQIDRQDITTRMQKIGTLAELENKDFWKSTI